VRGRGSDLLPEYYRQQGCLQYPAKKESPTVEQGEENRFEKGGGSLKTRALERERLITRKPSRYRRVKIQPEVEISPKKKKEGKKKKETKKKKTKKKKKKKKNGQKKKLMG